MRSFDEHATQSVCFELLADAEAGLLPRLLALFARRDLVPDQVRSLRRGDIFEVLLGMTEMPADTVHLVEGNLRQVVGVRRLTVHVGEAVRAAA